MSDWTDDPEWEAFVRHVREDAAHKIEESAFVMSFIPERDKVDVKFAVELGLSILFDKPLLCVVMPGTPISERMRRVCDRIIEVDPDVEAGQEAMREALKEMLDK